jgi:quinol monooxygenase YgiN
MPERRIFAQQGRKFMNIGDAVAASNRRIEEHHGGIISMAKYALYVALKAKPGEAPEVEAFLKQGAEMAKAEKGTLTWYGIKEDDGAYAVFDTFDDEGGRDAHLNGEIAKALMAKADELFSNKLQIHKIQVIASK